MNLVHCSFSVLHSHLLACLGSWTASLFDLCVEFDFESWWFQWVGVDAMRAAVYLVMTVECITSE